MATLSGPMSSTSGRVGLRRPDRQRRTERAARWAGVGADILSGLAEDDSFHGGTGTNGEADGADTFVAGAQGSAGDTVSYNRREDPITVDIGGGPDSDGDDVGPEIDNLIGGEEDDTLTGGANANRLFGRRGR